MASKYFFFGFLLCLILVPITKVIAIKLKITDKPDKRKQHNKPKPLLGGLAVYLSIFLIYQVYASFQLAQSVLNIWLLGLALVIVGIIDDAFDMSSYLKLFFQLVISYLAASILGGIDSISFFGITLYFSNFIGILVITGWIVVLINAFNLIDGLDGLATGSGIISFGTILIMAMLNNNFSEVVLFSIYIGVLLGFLFYNFYPSTIFLGDAGSMFIGYSIAILSTTQYKTVTFTSLSLLLLVAFLPVLDTILSFLRRRVNKVKVFKADNLHFHHRLLRHGYSHQVAVLIMYAFMIIYSIFAIIFTFGTPAIKAGLIVVVFITTIIIFEKFYLLSNRHTYVLNFFAKLFGRKK